MNKLQKDAIYDEVCHLLTDYETNELYQEYAAEDLYDMLVKIQNCWEELTSEDSE